MTEMIETRINQRWSLKLPAHRVSQWAAPWEAMRLDSMNANLRPGDLVFDIGTEQGDMSALIASWGCRMVLVEPSAPMWPTIRATWAGNELPEPVACFPGFVGDETRNMPNVIAGWPPCATGAIVEEPGFRAMLQSPQIPRITIDSLTEIVGAPSAITMDVEGSELLALRCAEKTLRTHRPLVWVSVHPQFIADEYKMRVTDLWDYLRTVGYQWRLLDYDHELHTICWPEERRPVLPWD